MDVFGEGYGLGETILALLIHLVPVYLVLGVLALAWRWEWIGAAFFTALAVFYLVMTAGREHWAAYVTISGSLFLVGGLFLLNWIYRSQLRAQN